MATQSESSRKQLAVIVERGTILIHVGKQGADLLEQTVWASSAKLFN